MNGMHVPAELCENQFCTVEPQINAEGVHVWPFDAAFPIDVRFMALGPGDHVRKNRHDYFELLYLCAGPAQLVVQDRCLSLEEGDLSIVGSTFYHRFECSSADPMTACVLFFHPDLIRADGGPESTEYLTPFLLQDSQFPHVVAGSGSVSGQVFDLMQRIRSELPATTSRSRLSVKTYLKMILVLLVNEYASYAGVVETYQRQQRALARLSPLFSYLENHYADRIQVQKAARICGMSESHFMSFFKQTTGQSFMVYLNHCRIERALELLAATDRSVSEISQDVGFCDQSYFGTVFRKAVAMTPAAYRARSRGDLRNRAADRSRLTGHLLQEELPGKLDPARQTA